MSDIQKPRSIFSSLAGCAIAPLVMFPFARYQTSYQTQLIYNNMAKLSQNFKNGAFRAGFSHYYVYALGHSLITNFSRVGGILSPLIDSGLMALVYPWEVQQILASSSVNNSAAPLQKLAPFDLLSNYSNKVNWIGFEAAAVRNLLFLYAIKTNSYLLIGTAAFGCVTIDNIRRNFVVSQLSSEGEKLSYEQIFNKLKENPKQLIRGASLYPMVYVLALGLFAPRSSLTPVPHLNN